ncbi:MAG: encapsulin-associated ferritin-like protein [Acidimicrobiales bacterium]
MAQSSGSFHESAELLSLETMDRHRAIVSLMEELEAVDWYDQRIDATEDPSLAAILLHNRDEEKEHASMLLEWIRRRDSMWDEHLSHFLFTDKPIADPTGESAAPSAPAGASSSDGGAARSLRIGALAGKEVL